MNSECRGYGVELWRWAAMVVLRVGNDEEKRAQGRDWVIGREVLREMKEKLSI